MHRLYLYYCYQLGILPKKQQPRINRPELERIWKDTERILAEHAFVHDHKFPSLQAIVDYRKGLSQRMETLTAQRAEVVKQMRRKDAPPELADQRMILTCQIAKLRKEDKIADGAIKRIQRTRESNHIDRVQIITAAETVLGSADKEVQWLTSRKSPNENTKSPSATAIRSMGRNA